jgi:nicotinamide riboside kinase
MINVAICGPESSGKTALAIALSVHFKTFYVPEFARVYLEKKGSRYTANDLEEIILNQIEWWQGDHLRLPADALRFWDGDPSILRVWEDERFGTSNAAIDAFVAQHPPELTLLCAPDLPWSYDPLRENPTDRERLFNRYREQLNQWKLPYAIVDGSGSNRLRSAVKAITHHLGINED